MEKVKNRIISEKKKGILGINIGPNKNTKDQKNDFCLGLKNFFDIADYITINISSPNTKDLRNFHDKEKLEDLLLSLNKIKKESKTNIPLLLKVSPDIKDNHIDEIIDVALKIIPLLSIDIELINVSKIASSMVNEKNFLKEFTSKNIIKAAKPVNP